MTWLIKHCARENVAEGDFRGEMFFEHPKAGLNVSWTRASASPMSLSESPAICQGQLVKYIPFCLITCPARPLWREIRRVQDKHKSTNPWVGHKQAACFLLIKGKCQQREKLLDFLFTVKSGGAAKTAPPLKPRATEPQKRTLRTTGGKDGMNGERNMGCHLINGMTF